MLVRKGDDIIAECDHGGCRTKVVLDLSTGSEIATYVSARYGCAVTGEQLCEGQAVALGWFQVRDEVHHMPVGQARWLCPAHPEDRHG
jgi:hypothetical protein